MRCRYDVFTIAVVDMLSDFIMQRGLATRVSYWLVAACPLPGGGSIGGPRHRFKFLLSCVIRAGGPDRGSAGRGDSKKCVLVPGLARLSAGVGLQGLLGSQPA